ncbi:MAG: polysaccharide deacetylase family protein [Sulfuricurvum sp.]|uniref:polysaccharide deacetylase family protein n=1 Tax=Sulfuricurvum sp. TaxID=2025608 RepID=UPI0025FB87BA|nr:polysaccharide deacetylase family protein [Sulfuricurvum sp.]MCK9372240.1 polysaccharide deacetylase family protein [Sulfuricurvum sp.]
MTSLTVDYEFDWGGRIKSWRAIEKMTIPLLECFEKAGAKATFFVSGETVESTKPFLKMIANAGHEIASHGFNHNLRYDLLTKEELLNEIVRSKGVLEEATGNEIIGFRTPQFRKNQWTEEVLTELGFLYDSSSVNTSLAGRYKERQYEYGLLPQIPVSTIYGRFPAGTKWINILGKKIDPHEHKVIYLHPFDSMSIKETLNSYRKEIPLSVLAFYLTRFGSILKTVEHLSKDSVTLASTVRKSI